MVYTRLMKSLPFVMGGPVPAGYNDSTLDLQMEPVSCLVQGEEACAKLV